MCVCLRGGGEGLASLAQLLWLYGLDSAYCKCVCCWSGAVEALQCGRSREGTFCTTVPVCVHMCGNPACISFHACNDCVHSCNAAAVCV